MIWRHDLARRVDAEDLRSAALVGAELIEGAAQQAAKADAALLKDWAERLRNTKDARAINFNVLTDRAGMDGFLRQGGIQTDTTGILGLLVYWLVVLAALIIGFNSLGLTYITGLLGQVVLFVPKVIVALLILSVGTYFARFVGTAVVAYCKNVDIQDAEVLGTLARYAIVTFVVLIALDQVNVGGDIVRESFLIILAGFVFAVALAFGLGGRHAAADLIDRWWPRQNKSDGG